MVTAQIWRKFQWEFYGRNMFLRLRHRGVILGGRIYLMKTYGISQSIDLHRNYFDDKEFMYKSLTHKKDGLMMHLCVILLVSIKWKKEHKSHSCIVANVKGVQSWRSYAITSSVRLWHRNFYGVTLYLRLRRNLVEAYKYSSNSTLFSSFFHPSQRDD